MQASSRPFSPLLRPLTLLLLTTALTAAYAQDKVVLKVKADPGQTSKYKSTSTVEFTFEGETTKFATTEETLVKSISTDAKGVVSFDRLLKSSKTNFDGEEIDNLEDVEGDQGTLFSLKANGEVVTYKDKDKEALEADIKMSARMMQATSPIFLGEAVSAGQKWTVDLPGNTDIGIPKAKGNYTLTAFETILGVKTAKIDFNYEETGEKVNMKASGTVWIELSSGDSIKQDLKFKDIPFDMEEGEAIKAIAAGTTERTDGTFIASEAKTQDPNTNPTKDPEKKEPEKGSIDAKIKDFEKMDGLFTIYRKVDEGRTRIYMEIKRSQLNKLVMLQATASTGTPDRLVAGDPISDVLFEFREMPNNKIFLVVPNFSFRAKAGTPTETAIKRSFSESIIDSYDIDAKQKDRDSVLIDISSFFMGSLSRVQESLMSSGGIAALMGGGAGYVMDREKSYMKTLKNFPTNTYAEVKFAFVGRGGSPKEPGEISILPDNRGMVVNVDFNLFMLPTDNGYEPRRFDPRVGYFTTEYLDFTNDQAVDRKVVNITRWNLKKKDPKAALSDPVKPITFWIDNGVPMQYRAAIKSALLSWNPIFERSSGIKNAVIVNQMPPNAEFDHADMRYNVVRWVVSPSEAYAVAQARINPITGEILNASITVDAGLVQTFAAEFNSTVDPSSYFNKINNPKTGSSSIQCLDKDAAKAMALQARVGAMAIELINLAGGNVSKEEYVKQFVQWVVTHESGHLMGLRHNFSSSNMATMEQLGNAEYVKANGTTSSIMDYVPFNPSALGKPGVRFFGSGPGRQDEFAIKYGYMETGMKGSDNELPSLRKFASTAASLGYNWQSDEEADSIDPYVTRFDLAADPLNYWLKMIQVSRHLIFELDKLEPKSGQSYHDFTRAFEQLIAAYSMSASQASRFLGGVRRSVAQRGDAGGMKPITAVPAVDQRKALQMLSTYIFSESAFDFPKRYYKLMTRNPKGSFTESMIEGFNDYPMFREFSSIQDSALRSVLGSSTLGRVMNNEFEAEKGESVLSLNEVFSTVKTAVWSDLKGGKAIAPLRRQLQRSWIDRMITLGIDTDRGRTDINVMALSQLREMMTDLNRTKSSDAATQAHIMDSRMRISKALNAVQTLGGSSPSPLGGTDLSDLLGGAKKKGR